MALSYFTDPKEGSRGRQSCSGVQEGPRPFEAHLWGQSMTIGPAVCVAAPRHSPRAAPSCAGHPQRARDERRRMQTSEELRRPCFKENTANSLLIIQTSGFALSSSRGFVQEAQPRMLGEGGRTWQPPGPGCTWGRSPAGQAMVWGLPALSSPLWKWPLRATPPKPKG